MPDDTTPNPPPGRWLDLTLDDRRGTFTLSARCRLPPGWTALFGPSGSGKTSLLRLIAGLDRPQTGSITLNRHDRGSRVLTDTSQAIHLPPEKRRVALVTQRPALFPHRSVRGNLLYGAPSSPPSRLADLADLCHIQPLLDRRIATLSGGERQRVALARALMPADTDVLLLDEPFTGLGEQLRDTILLNLRAWLRPQGMPVLLVTHDLGEIFASGAAVLRFEHGRITAIGTAADVLAPERAATLARLSAHPQP